MLDWQMETVGELSASGMFVVVSGHILIARLCYSFSSYFYFSLPKKTQAQTLSTQANSLFTGVRPCAEGTKSEVKRPREGLQQIIVIDKVGRKGGRSIWIEWACKLDLPVAMSLNVIKCH